jgi:hypothetical protein
MTVTSSTRFLGLALMTDVPVSAVDEGRSASRFVRVYM